MTVDSYAIDVSGLCKSFGSRLAVDHLSLQVKTGEIYGFLGPNGSGKTTAIRMMCGLLTPDAGQGRCLGFDILKERLQIKHAVGYMTQGFSLYQDLTIQENLDFIARIYNLDHVSTRVTQALKQLGLFDRKNQLAGGLSGGWKQRLALAACMIHAPQLLLLDEPTAGVDPKARRDFWDELHKLASTGISVLVSTHYMDEAERCHRLAYINQGKLIAKGTAEEIIKASGLSTWQIRGEEVHRLAAELHLLPGIEQVVPFGSVLHVSGSDADLMQKTLAGYLSAKSYPYESIQSGLEDAFIRLMGTGSVAD